RLWNHQAQHEEIARWFERALASPGPIEPDLRAEALFSLSRTQMFADHRSRQDILQECLQLFRQSGNDRRAGHVLIGFGNNAFTPGDLQQAMEFQQQALDIFQRVEEPSGAAHALGNIGTILINTERYDEAELAFNKARESAASVGDRWSLSSQLYSLG